MASQNSSWVLFYYYMYPATYNFKDETNFQNSNWVLFYYHPKKLLLKASFSLIVALIINYRFNIKNVSDRKLV